jgi:PAS domain S-box-containing protein
MLSLAQATPAAGGFTIHWFSYSAIIILLAYIVFRFTRAQQDARNTHRELIRREQQLAEAQQIAHLGSWEWDVGKNTVSWSAELYRIYDVDPATPINYQVFLDHVHEEDRERVNSIVGAAIDRAAPFEYRHRVRRRDGAVRHIQARGRIIKGEDGLPVRLVGTALDITDQYDAEQQHRMLETEHAARIEAETVAQEMQILAEAGATLSNSLDYEETLKNAARVLIPSLGELSIVDVLENGNARRAAVAHSDNRLQFLAQKTIPFAPSLENDRHPAVQAIRLRRPVVVAGQEHFQTFAQSDAHAAMLDDIQPKAGLFFPLIGREGPIGVVAVFSLTERRYTNREMILGEELARRMAAAVEHAILYRDADEANRVKATFLGVISHELRTPLNAVLGYADILDAELSGSLNELQRKHVQRIIHTGGHLSRIIEEILAFTRLEAGREVVKREVVDVNDVAREAFAMVVPAASGKQIQAHFAPAQSGAFVETDPTKLRQIFANLLSNAVKFTDSGTITLSVEANGDDVICSLRDTGIGMTMDQLPLIFDAFWQADNQNTRRNGGTGLGLAVTRKLAELLEAELTVQSEYGMGTEFSLRLPATKPVTAGQ